MVQRCIFDNGVRVVTETMPDVGSASLGIWVENGSRYETRERAGISHYLEHLFFKGTDRRTAAQIAEEFEGVGGHFNAFTGKECTCYYAKVLAEHLPLAQDILSDILLHSRFQPDEIERERSVVIQEILQNEDTPDDFVHDLFSLQYWPEHPLSFPVCGRMETVEAFTQRDFLDFIAERYRPNRLLIAATGKVDHDRIVEWAQAQFGDLRGVTEVPEAQPPAPNRSFSIIEKPLEQMHLCFGAPGISQTAADRFAAYLMNTALGGGMSSRLFQEVREKRGRAYSVYSFLSSYADGGCLGIYAGTSPQWVAEVIGLIRDQLDALRHSGLRPEELTRVKNQLKGNLLLGLETSDNRMNRIARNEIYMGEDMTPAEVARRIDATTNDEIVALACSILRPEDYAVTILGDLKGHHVDESILDG
jgi:predicted Zn-dependent peptidase